MSRWTIWVLVMVTVALAACQSMSSVKPGDGRKATITGKSYDQIWDAAHKVSNEHFQIREQDKTRGVIVGERPMSAWSYGAWVGAYITPPTPGAPAYTVEVVRRKKMTRMSANRTGNIRCCATSTASLDSRRSTRAAIPD